MFKPYQTDIYFLDIRKSHYRLTCHKNDRILVYIYMCIYLMVDLLKSHDN